MAAHGRPPLGEDEKALIQAVVEAPSDKSLKLAYADFLEERGRHEEAELQIESTLPHGQQIKRMIDRTLKEIGRVELLNIAEDLKRNVRVQRALRAGTIRFDAK